jgi:hypothetical protein
MKMPYLVHMQSHMGLLYIQDSMYIFLCGFWQNSQHFWHICKDQHIAHSDMLEWWDIQGQLDIHTVCIEYMGQGLAYILVDRSKQLCDF